MRRQISFILCFLGICTLHETAMAQRIIGTVAPYRNSVSNRVHLFHSAGMAIIYDQPAPGKTRVRLLTADGRVSDVPKGILGNSLFDEYAWNEREKTLYALPYHGPLYRLDAAKRQFVLFGGRTFQYRQMRYIPRWGAMALVGDGLSVVRRGKIASVRSTGPPVGHAYYVRDVPRFRALMISDDKRQFMRTADGTVHFLGEGSIERVAALNSRPAIQLSGPRVAFDVTMGKDSKGVWRPVHVRRVPLEWGMGSMLRTFVPTIDATLVHQPGWQWLDRWRGRSGYYKLGPEGLVPVGDFRQRSGQSSKIITLTSLNTDFLEINGIAGVEPSFWRIARSGAMTRETSPHAAGRWFNIWESQRLVYLTGAGGAWLWDGRSSPRQVADFKWPTHSALPLSDELLLSDGKQAIIIDPHGKPTRLERFASGEVLQVARHRLFVIGPKILEIDLPAKR